MLRYVLSTSKLNEVPIEPDEVCVLCTNINSSVTCKTLSKVSPVLLVQCFASDKQCHEIGSARTEVWAHRAA